ncbi:trans-aconitate 2-methyltransferase [Mycobacterium sp.]|jgi:trans-aconitate 2-methyltransferase|uniref:trans-aconitate 2-methyltransferase n=1 Tax=Mycobacterium sp. TaxID=1785 RepID=UPI002D4C6824|nr:trans-aconitate 2-methyltransferase [Mycobacterium sp.]HZA12178.1 trans-aconitate 2-methyltransferase [Mycobacterium sp.]
MRWDPAQYGRFANERNRAFLDLTARIETSAPKHVVDVGCGPGNLTGLLAQRWPHATVEGIDSSPEMIAASTKVPGVKFSMGDAADWRPGGDVDVIVSNAALQWVPRHQQLMAQWASALPSGGWLAVQVPGNFNSPSHTLLRSLADEQRWAPELRNVVHHGDAVGTPESYAQVLLNAGMVADVWETTYLHVLHGDDPVLEWMRGTGLRPLLAALSPHDADEFCAQFAARLREAYPRGPHGTVFAFRRVFAVGHQPSTPNS